jgi:WD40 repeat protein
LSPFLAKVCEIIMKTMDPHVPNLRQELLPVTTNCLHELVSNYAAVAFHAASQRLAVGGADGTTTIYDLKTATRWHVLEASEK